MNKNNGHHELQTTRRNLEAELNGIDDAIRKAISAGNAVEMGRLMARRKELPLLFVEASMKETNARRELFKAEDAENIKRLRSFEDNRDAAKARLDRRRAEVEAELVQLALELQAAEDAAKSAQTAVKALRDHDGRCEAGRARSLAQVKL